MEAQEAGYRPTARMLHWSVALIVLGMIPAGLLMTSEGLPRGLRDALFIFHKNAGVVVLVLVAIRILYRLRHRPPPLPASVPSLQRHVAETVHLLLYGVLLAMSLSGYVRVRAGGFPVEMLDAVGLPPLVPRSDALAQIAKRIHFLAHYAIIALVLLHIAGALHHALWRRDGLIRRMWPPLPASASAAAAGRERRTR